MRAEAGVADLAQGGPDPTMATSDGANGGGAKPMPIDGDHGARRSKGSGLGRPEVERKVS
jgi:hypothetical protein